MPDSYCEVRSSIVGLVSSSLSSESGLGVPLSCSAKTIGSKSTCTSDEDDWYTKGYLIWDPGFGKTPGFIDNDECFG